MALFAVNTANHIVRQFSSKSTLQFLRKTNPGVISQWSKANILQPSKQQYKFMITVSALRSTRNSFSHKNGSLHPGQYNVFWCKFHGLVGRETLKNNINTAGGLFRRFQSQKSSQNPRRNNGKEKDKTSIVLYIVSMGILMLGVSYAGVPLYKMFCQAMGVGGQISSSKGHDASRVEKMEKVPDRQIYVRFTADVEVALQWKFKPQQSFVKVAPGETALVFYTATNPTDKPIIGISTYTVNPPTAANYFNKIQCFCFEEQILNPHEQVDMPVFFYIDPEYDDDPSLEYVDEIVLSYTFFEAKEGMTLPYPGFPTQTQ